MCSITTGDDNPNRYENTDIIQNIYAIIENESINLSIIMWRFCSTLLGKQLFSNIYPRLEIPF